MPYLCHFRFVISLLQFLSCLHDFHDEFLVVQFVRFFEDVDTLLSEDVLHAGQRVQEDLIRCVHNRRQITSYVRFSLSIASAVRYSKKGAKCGEMERTSPREAQTSG